VIWRRGRWALYSRVTLGALSLAARLNAIRDVAVARAFLGERLRIHGPAVLAIELEALLDRATRGASAARSAVLTVASWVAHVYAVHGGARLLALGVLADAEDLPLVRATFGTAEPNVSLAPRGRLPDVGIAVYANVSGSCPPRYPDQTDEEWRRWAADLARSPWMRAYRMKSMLEGARMHHDPVFIGRLLDQDWVQARDVLLIAARRPTTAGHVLAIATRERWFRSVAIREAIAWNPYSPPILSRVLAFASGPGRSRHFAAP
jgi:hypothetical protein